MAQPKEVLQKIDQLTPQEQKSLIIALTMELPDVVNAAVDALIRVR